MALVDFYGNAVRLSSAYRTYLPGTAADETVTGTSGADLIGQNGRDTLIGLDGDDTYGSVSMLSTIVEQANGGIDTIYAFGEYVMPANVENLFLVGGTTVWGNSGANYIVGNDATNLINGKGGDDVLTGGGGADIFEFNAAAGFDLITDFTHKSDSVRLLGYSQFNKFADVTAAMRQDGADVVLTLSAQSQVKFQNTTIADFSVADFKLGIDKTDLVLTFRDDFNTLSLDTGSGGTWRTRYDFGGDSNSIFSRTLQGNAERQYYSDSVTTGSGTTPVGVNPFSLDNGSVVISARPASATLQESIYGLDFTSGVLTTYNSFAQQYGYFESRIDVPEGQGAWPAFWLLPVDGSHPPELDIMENYGDNVVVLTAHSRNNGEYVADVQGFSNFDLASGYHKFGMLWTETTITWYVDDVAIRTIATPDDAKRPMYMLLNLAVSSNAPDSFAADMKVDYVRAYALGSNFVDPLAGVYAPPVVVPTTPNGNADVFIGTSGNDNYIVDNVADQVIEQANAGTDHILSSVDYTLPTNVENLTLTGAAIRGTGNALNNTIVGNNLNNVIDGGGGTDTLKGGAGDDVYHVDATTVTVFEAANEGYDTVMASVNFALLANVEELQLSGSATMGTGSDLANVLRANDLGNTLNGQGGNDKLFGSAGSDYLDGGTGSDEMSGGAGDDRYRVDNTGDLVTELPGGGYDTVWTYANYTLSANIEELWLFGSALNGVGNDDANSINGNGLANRLEGKGGDDWIDGGAGADVMVGGTGNDVYMADDAGDRIVELAGEGIDQVWSFTGGVLASNVEIMMLVGSAVVGTGNAGNNTITGNALANVIDGGRGDDILQGGAGADTFKLNASFGRDTITDFNVREDVIDWSAIRGQYAAPVLSQTSDGVVATFGSNTLTLLGTSVALVNAYHVFG